MDFDDFEFEDCFIIGGIIGYNEEDTREKKRIEREQEIDEPCNEGDYEKLIP